MYRNENGFGLGQTRLAYILRAKRVWPETHLASNKSTRDGYLPAIWRSAIVIPIPKVNSPRIISKGLRPISLIAVLSKQLEKIVEEWMLDYIIDRLDVNQYGRPYLIPMH